jgi:uncharacterized protein (TIGR03435 family)
LCCAILCCGAAVLAQEAPALQFEVASVRPSPPPQPGQVSAGVHIDGAQVHLAYLSIKDLIRAAYQVKDYQIQAPDFTTSERFDISAKVSVASTREQVNEMIRSLLAERFGLKLHRESKEFPVYALVVAKGGLKMTEMLAETDVNSVNVTSTASRTTATVDLGHGAMFTVGEHTFEAHKLTMVNLADMLARFEDLPVIDFTGAKGVFDFTLEIKPEEFLAMKVRSAVVAGVSLPPEALKLLDNASDDSLQAALGKQGLKLERRRAPLDVLVIDHVEKTPTEN